MIARRRIVRRPAARIDVVEAAERIGASDPEAAVRFVEGVRETERMLLADPGIGATREFDNAALVGIRFHLVRGFRKYLIFYLPRSDGIEVVRVLHGARDLETIFDS
jgi:toxin ParE1/3/4